MKGKGKGGLDMTRKTSALVASVVLALTIMAAAAVSATAAKKSTKAAPTLVGAWLVTVDRGPAGPLNSLQTYARGGVFTETSNLVPGGLRGPGHGAWSRAGDRRYDATELFFRYDPQTGDWVGYVKLRSRIELGAGGDSLTATTVAQALDTNRNPIGPPRTDTAVGERINVEPLPVS
jgi:hypothetical protein